MLHRHHIKPKHDGGTDDPSNIEYLTVEQHAEAHKILFERFGRWQDEIAWKSLLGLIGKEEIQKEAARRANFGRIRSPETRAKISLARRGKKHSSLHVENNSRAQRGKVLSESTRRKISESQKVLVHTPEHNAKVGRKGRVFSEETRRKMSDAARKRYEKRNGNEYRRAPLVEGVPDFRCIEVT